MVRQSCEIETNIVSVERIKEYIELPQEAPAEIPGSAPPASWPISGMIEFQNYSTRYRPELPLVVKDLSFTVQPREKVGIVGRTGAGTAAGLTCRQILHHHGSVSHYRGFRRPDFD